MPKTVMAKGVRKSGRKSMLVKGRGGKVVGT